MYKTTTFTTIHLLSSTQTPSSLDHHGANGTHDYSIRASSVQLRINIVWEGLGDNGG